MDWTNVILRVIELDTFDNIWFWMAVVVAWAVACHWMIGVPFDLLVRARRGEEEAQTDLEALVAINLRRFSWFYRYAGAGFVGLAAFFLAGTALLAVVYRFEFAIGLLVLGGPLMGVALMNLRLALSLIAAPLEGRALVSRLLRVRVWTQVAAAFSLFVTAVYGMAFNIAAGNFY